MLSEDETVGSWRNERWLFYPSETHQCTSACRMELVYASTQLWGCLESGCLHRCTPRECGHLRVSSDSTMVCDLTRRDHGSMIAQSMFGGVRKGVNVNDAQLPRLPGTDLGTGYRSAADSAMYADECTMAWQEDDAVFETGSPSAHGATESAGGTSAPPELLRRVSSATSVLDANSPRGSRSSISRTGPARSRSGRSSSSRRRASGGAVLPPPPIKIHGAGGASRAELAAWARHTVEEMLGGATRRKYERGTRTDAERAVRTRLVKAMGGPRGVTRKADVEALAAQFIEEELERRKMSRHPAVAAAARRDPPEDPYSDEGVAREPWRARVDMYVNVILHLWDIILTSGVEITGSPRTVFMQHCLCIMYEMQRGRRIHLNSIPVIPHDAELGDWLPNLTLIHNYLPGAHFSYITAGINLLLKALRRVEHASSPVSLTLPLDIAHRTPADRAAGTPRTPRTPRTPGSTLPVPVPPESLSARAL